MSLTALPKIELHLHLEGAAPPQFIRQMASEQGRKLAGVFDEAGHYLCRDFNHFLRVYEEATSVLTGPEAFARLTTAVLEQSAEHGVVYTEVFLSPDFCGGGDVGAWREHVAAIEEAASVAEARLGITLRGIVTAIRHFGPGRSRAPAICAAETAGTFIRGFGLAGDELRHHPADFLWAFDCAREAGLAITAHAGEWGGATSVRETLDTLKPARIGHGVQAIDDPALVDILIDRGTVLECCPGSNTFLGVYPTLAAHPIEKLRAAGVKVTVSTDDPPFFHTTMTQEYERLADVFGWDEAIFAEINATALAAAFCDADTRARIAKRLEAE
ncbi:MAG: adenosine deaminase [Pseudomonadota bacterium]